MNSSVVRGLILVLAVLAMAGIAGADDGRGTAPPPALGGKPAGPKLVLQQKPDFVLWAAQTRIEPGTVGLVYQVEQSSDLRLLLSAPGHGLRGWALAREVIPVDGAEEYFTHSITSKPENPFGYLMRGIARLETGNDEGALADISEAIRRNPRYVPALVRRAAILRARNQPDKALADVEQAIAADGKEPSAYVERAVLAFTRRDLEKTWKFLERATALGSKDIIVDVMRGQILLERKDAARAYDAFMKALTVDPLRHDACLGLASVYLMQGHPQNAQAVLDDAVRRDPKNPEAYGNRATLGLARGDYEKALADLGEVIRLSPGSARAYNERARVWATCPVEKLREPQAAVESARKACELTGGMNPYYMATLALAYSEVNEFSAAADAQERAVSLLPRGARERDRYVRLLARYRARKPHHALGLLEELGIRPYDPEKTGS